MKTYLFDNPASRLSRARAYVEATPGAIAGNRGHDQTFRVACKLVEFGLTPDEACNFLTEYNARCSPPWSEKELAHKLRDAYRLARPQIANRFSPSYLPASRPKVDPATAVENFLRGIRYDDAALWEASPIRPPDDWKRDACLLCEALFLPGELVNYVTEFAPSAKDGAQKANPRGTGESVERDALLTRWREHGLPQSDAGGWLRMNPLDGLGIADANVTAFRFALLECDCVPLALQLPLLARLPLPITAILTSGGRSLHAWIKIDAPNADEYRAAVSRMLTLLARFGVDQSNKNPSRLSRLPGVVRKIGATGDGLQRLLFLNPAPKQKAIL